ncbi:hypothetical protein JZ751_008517 [Albula glossodonta]|uniref:Uncharacterized protein n=1 Tax=Albula glossodonta TaxID=121402 RepID=A0A8T2MX51_9TELE|nr:hypothetical protein JZ751_008517 [Albula glossodonta]
MAQSTTGMAQHQSTMQGLPTSLSDSRRGSSAKTSSFVFLLITNYKPPAQCYDHRPDPSDQTLLGSSLGPAVLWLLHIPNVLPYADEKKQALGLWLIRWH